jgi:hypothetical protein
MAPQGLLEAPVRPQGLSLSRRDVICGNRRQSTNTDILERTGRLTSDARREQIDLDPAPQERPKYFLNVNRAAFPAENGHSRIRADVCQLHIAVALAAPGRETRFE